MKRKFHIFPVMILAVVVIFGLKSYDFAMGFAGQTEDRELAEVFNDINTAAGQQQGEDLNADSNEADDLGALPVPGAFPYSGQEIALLQKLVERREALDERAQQMDVREKLLIVTENGIDKKIASLKNIEAQIRALVTLHDEQEAAQIDNLVKTYSAMKPKDAAKIFNTLDMDILISIIEKMKPKAIANVLSKMQTASANEITVELATRKKMPQIEG